MLAFEGGFFRGGGGDTGESREDLSEQLLDENQQQTQPDTHGNTFSKENLNSGSHENYAKHETGW